MKHFLKKSISLTVAGIILIALFLVWECQAPDDKKQFKTPATKAPFLLHNTNDTRSYQPELDNNPIQLKIINGKSIWENPTWKKKGRIDNNSNKPELYLQKYSSVNTNSIKSATFSPEESIPFNSDNTDTNRKGIPVLCYHHNFKSRKTFAGFNVHPRQLKKQLKYLYDNGYRTISMHQLELFIRGQSVTLPARPVVITFDDGLKSNYTEVLPLLTKYSMRATLFIYPGIIGKKKKYYLSWKELKLLANSGHFEIGSHTYNHPRLPEHSLKEIRRQLGQSKRMLEKKLGVEVSTLAYPFGVYNQTTLREAGSSGYKLAFTIHPGANVTGMNPLTLNRYMVTNAHNLKTFQVYLNMRSDKIHHASPPDGSRIKPGDTLNLHIPGLKVTGLKLGGKKLKFQQSLTRLKAILPAVKSSLGYLPLEIRAKDKTGNNVFRQMLYLDKRKL